MKTLKIATSIFVLTFGQKPALAQETAVPKMFSNESEIGAIVQKGNVDTETINARQMNEVNWAGNVFRIEGKHIRVKSDDSLASRFFSLGVRYERELIASMNLFTAHLIEADKPAGLELRNSTDLGTKYKIFETETLKWNAEAGYRYIAEEPVIGASVYDHALRAYTEAIAQVNASNALKYWLEYIPSLSHDENYRINTEVSLAAQLTDIISAKVAYLYNYNNNPSEVGRKRSDHTTTLSLLSKF